MRTEPTGQFGIGPLSPGTYTLTAVRFASGPRLSGYTTVWCRDECGECDDHDGPTFDIEGRIAVEGLPNADMSSISVRAVSTVNAIADAPK